MNQQEQNVSLQEDLPNIRETSIRPVQNAPKRGFYGVTIEPCLLFYTFALSLTKIFMINLMVDKVCLFHFHYSPSVCQNLDSQNYSAEQREVQQVTNRYGTYQLLIQNIPGMYFTLVMAHWIQHRGKVLPLLLCHTAQLLQSAIYLVNSVWFSLHPAWLLLADVPQGLSGGVTVTVMTSYSIIADNTNTHARTIRMAIIQMIFDLSFPLGYYLGTYFFELGGYKLVFGVQCFVNVLDLVYVSLFCLICTRELTSEDAYCHIISSEGVPILTEISDLVEVGVLPRRGTHQYSPLLKVFSPVWMVQQIRTSFHVPANTRERIIGLCVVYFLITFSLTSTNYLFLFTRLLFSWNYLDFTKWTIFTFLMASAGAVVAIPVLSYICQLPDDALNAFSSLFNFVSFLLIAFAQTPMYLYISSFTAIFGSLAPFTYVRSSMSKLVTGDQLVVIFAILGVIGNVSLSLSSLLDTLIYNTLIGVFPGAVFMLASLMHLGAALTLWIIIRSSTRTRGTV